MKTIKALRACMTWIAYCVRIGFDKSAVSELEVLWWKYHDENGNLIKSKADETTRQ